LVPGQKYLAHSSFTQKPLHLILTQLGSNPDAVMAMGTFYLRVRRLI
jgi:hypothetical protein